MIPALAVQLRTKRIDPDGPGRVPPGVFAELVRGAEAESALEFRITFLAALPEHAVERQLETAFIGVMAGAPVTDPDGPRIRSIRSGEDQPDACVARVAGDGALPEIIQRWKPPILLDQVG